MAKVDTISADGINYPGGGGQLPPHLAFPRDAHHEQGYRVNCRIAATHYTSVLKHNYRKLKIHYNFSFYYYYCYCNLFEYSNIPTANVT